MRRENATMPGYGQSRQGAQKTVALMGDGRKCLRRRGRRWQKLMLTRVVGA
jgi:hypothetical protein